MQIIGLSGCRVELSKPMRHAHRHQEVEINFVERGHMRILCVAESVTVEAGGVIAFWAAWPHQIVETTPDCRMVWFTVPLEIFLSWSLPSERVSQLMRGGYWQDQSPAKRNGDPVVITRWLEDLRTTPADPELRHLLEIELKARLFRLARATAVATGTRRPAGGQGGLTRLIEVVARHFRDPVSVEQIAGLAGLNPRYATALLKKELGIGLHQYLMRHRLAYAQQQLLETDKAITTIAYASGFQSISVFYEWFERSCGCAPGAFRRRHSEAGADH